MEGDTSTIEAAHQLGKLCEGRHLVVNLIPYNRTDVKDELNCPSEEHMQEFRRIVSLYGSFCSIRRTMGADIAGACGQLVVEQEKKQQEHDIEDGPFRKEESGLVVGRERTITTLSSNNRAKKISEKMQHDEDDPKKSGSSDDPWVRRLTIATTVAASCFVLSGTLLLLQKRKR